jgi:hypothetical protein
MRRRTYRGRGQQTSAGRLTEAWRKGSREDAKTRKVWDRVPKLPMTFCCNEGVLECSGLTELWMGIERADGKLQSGVKPPQSKKPGSGLNFLIQISNFRFPHSPQPPSPRFSTPVSRPNSPISVMPQLRDLGSFFIVVLLPYSSPSTAPSKCAKNRIRYRWRRFYKQNARNRSQARPFKPPKFRG